MRKKKEQEFVYKTLRLRVRDKHASFFRKQANEVNFVWNFVRDTTTKHTQRTGKFMSNFDLHKLTAGSTKEGLTIHATTIQAICDEYVTRRFQFKKLKLKARYGTGPKKALGWIPFKKLSIKIKDGKLLYQKKQIDIWDSYDLSKYTPVFGSFAENSRGMWFVNLVVKINKCDIPESMATGSVAVDLGLKDCATTSDGVKLRGKWYKKLEEKIRNAQRAKKKDRVRALHAKVKNQRKDEIHKFTSQLVKENYAIFIGDVKSTDIIEKPGLAKSTYDASWYQLKEMLKYKSHLAGIICELVDERYSTQTCSACLSIPASSPKGRAGLGIREWTCDNCGTTHDRDINAAMNILARGHARLAGGIPVLKDGEDVNSAQLIYIVEEVLRTHKSLFQHHFN